MKWRYVAVRLGVLAILTAIVVFLARDGYNTDLYSLVGGEDSQAEILRELNNHASSWVRVFCDDAESAGKCREIFEFEPAIDIVAARELFRTKGDGLLSNKSRELLKRGETEKIKRSAMRRDYTTVGVFSKKDDPYYLLHDFVMELKAMVPDRRAEAGEILVGRYDPNIAMHDANALRRLIDLSKKDKRVHLSGVPFHSLVATETTKREINILGLISIIVVLFMGYLLCGNMKFLPEMLFELAAGFLVATIAVELLCVRPHVLTFLFGTTLIGLGVDYCYHTMHKCYSKDLARAYVTTTMVFLPVLFSSVAVLRQMAIFTIAGITTIFLLSYKKSRRVW